jgi:L-serine dehydratase
MGPMLAAAMFVEELDGSGRLPAVREVVVDLYGSLALTGLGHNIDRALLLGLEGEHPDRVDVDMIDARVSTIRTAHEIRLRGHHPIPFVESRHVVFHKQELLPHHTNGLRVTARDAGGATLLSREYYSVGGGFVVTAEQATGATGPAATVPFDFQTAEQLLEIGAQHRLTIADIVRANERTLDPSRDVDAALLSIWEVMSGCIARGLRTGGELPGRLHVKRRAKGLAEKLERMSHQDPLSVMDWVSVWAMAVNEENAAGGRVVTAPTNGASGLLPGVLKYYTEYIDGASPDGVCTFLLTATAIGVLCKTNASISGAEIGCQGEVGVACAMAAAGLVAALGGTNAQMEHAAEIGIEHHLGMTCDPVAGLVQIPCIERNGVGAVQAIQAQRLAMQDDAEHRVSLDQVIETMRQTGRDMKSSYKETALAGLAVNVINC